MADPTGEQERCPTCGQAVTVHTGCEGTSSYVKVAEAERESLRLELRASEHNHQSDNAYLLAERDSLQAQLDEAEERVRYWQREHHRQQQFRLQAHVQLDEAREALEGTPYPDWWHKGNLGRAEQLRRFIDDLLRQRDRVRACLSPPTEGK